MANKILPLEGKDFITPIKPWRFGNFTNEEKTGTRNVGKGDGTTIFSNVFKSAVNEVRKTQMDVENKQYLLATGQLEDAHSLPIAEIKAAISLDLLISLRNKAIEGYNELLKLNI